MLSSGSRQPLVRDVMNSTVRTDNTGAVEDVSVRVRLCAHEENAPQNQFLLNGEAKKDKKIALFWNEIQKSYFVCLQIIFINLMMLFSLNSWAAQGEEYNRNARLRDISALQLSIGTASASEGECRLQRRALESFGVRILSEAGLQTLTTDEALERSRVNAEVLRRHLDALRAGRRLSDNEPINADQRRADIDFIRNLPFLMILFSTGQYMTPSGEIICTIAVSGDFSAPPNGSPIIGATGRSVFAPMILWRHSTVSAAAIPHQTSETAMEILREIVQSFIFAWREQNNRR